MEVTFPHSDILALEQSLILRHYSVWKISARVPCILDSGGFRRLSVPELARSMLARLTTCSTMFISDRSGMDSCWRSR